MLHEIILTQIGTTASRQYMYSTTTCGKLLPSVSLCRSETSAGKDERRLDLRGIDFIREMLARSSVSERLHYQDHREHVHLQHYCMIFF